VLWFVVDDGKHGASGVLITKSTETQDQAEARYFGAQGQVDRKVKFEKEVRKERNMREDIGREGLRRLPPAVVQCLSVRSHDHFTKPM
jgi:hypothetical protein